MTSSCWRRRSCFHAGLSGFANVPDLLAELPLQLRSHTSEIMSFGAYAGLDVAVVGAGQSALEAAALLHEAGAKAAAANPR